MNKLNYKREGITYEQKIKSNQFIKGKYKIGQVIKTNEGLINNEYTIVKLYDKGKYNLYESRNNKFNWRYDFTDMDNVKIKEEKTNE